MTLLKPYKKQKIVYNSLSFWDLEVSNSLKEAARQCASVDTLLASFEQKMSTKSPCCCKNSFLKGGRSLIASCALIFWS
jgi:hypothetical protein